MSKKKRVILDVDGVCLSWYLAMCRKYKKPYKTLDSWDGAPWLSKKFKEIANDVEFWRKLPNLSQPESLPKNVEVVAYLTACPKPMQKYREFNLQYNGWPVNLVIVDNEGKVDWLKENIDEWDIFVDDKPSTINACRVAFPNKKIVRFVPPYMDDVTQDLQDQYDRLNNSNLDKGKVGYLNSIKFLGQLKDI